MEVSVEKTGTLERRVTVQVPPERVEDEVTSRLKKLARSVKLDGFRPGKVPFKVVKSRYDGQVRSEVVSEVMQRTLGEALEQEHLHPAAGPQIEPKQMEPGHALEFSATFEVYPEIDLAPLAELAVEKPVAEVTDADVDRMLEKLQSQRVTWDEVEREAREGDRVVIDFEGTIDGEPFSGNKAENTPVVLGSETMIGGFEEQLTGARPGDRRTVTVEFPEDYGSPEVAGKTAEFEVDVVSVSEPHLPEIDDEFARSFGVKEGTVDALRAEVRGNMERELEQAVRSKVKEQVMDAVLQANELEVPQALVEQEIDRSLQQAQQQRPEMQQLDLPREAFKDSATRRVKLGLLVGEIIKAHNIELDPDRVRSTVDSIAASYEDPEQVRQLYASNRNMRNELEGHVLEEQVVDFLLEHAKVNEQQMSFDELMNPSAGGRG